MRPDPDSFCGDTKQMRDRQPFATAARLGPIMPGRQAAERWLAVCHYGSARSRLVRAPSGLEMTSPSLLWLGSVSSCQDAKQLRDSQLLPTAAGPGLAVQDAKQLGDRQSLAPAVRPGLVLPGHQAAERRPAVAHRVSARARLVRAPRSLETASLCPLRPGPGSSCRDTKQLSEARPLPLLVSSAAPVRHCG